MSDQRDPAWRQMPIDDADPEPCDPNAEAPCDACGLPTLLDAMYMDVRDRRLCPRCWFSSFELRPLSGVAA